MLLGRMGFPGMIGLPALTYSLDKKGRRLLPIYNGMPPDGQTSIASNATDAPDSGLAD